LPLPKHLWLASRRAPQLADRFVPVSGLPDQSFIAELDARYGGLSLLLENPALRDLGLPALRGDIALAEQYQFNEEPGLDIPLHVFYGTADRSLDLATVSAWRQHTLAGFSVHGIEAGHFFDEAARICLWKLLSDQLLNNKGSGFNLNIGWQHG
jgi:surfactin synthase thioesterase subunit